MSVGQKLPEPSRKLRPKDAANLLGISTATLYRWSRLRPGFPKPTKLSDRVTVFEQAELEAFVAQAGAVA
ncbi:helix-turn-helix transcriptional regulator [Piscinibacter defluvii]|uniref:helix-turn-helix transcriptional regulator n=1 Tax=Piscinibacter defluvii TaxID=1796922 RepID=UPI0013E3D1F9